MLDGGGFLGGGSTDGTAVFFIVLCGDGEGGGGF